MGLPQGPVTVADLVDADIVLVLTPATTTAPKPSTSHKPVMPRWSGTAVSQAAIRAGLPANRIATTVSGVEFRWRDVTIKSLPARHESTMTINEQFVADQPESFLLSTTADSRISCGGDVSISQDLKRGRSSQPNITVVERRRAPEFVPTIIVNDVPGHAAVRGPVRHSGDTRSLRLRTRP